jgi:cell division protease FtsH
LSKKIRTVAVWTLLILVFMAGYHLLGSESAPYAGFEVFLEHVETEMIESVRLVNTEIHVTLWGGYEYRTLGVVDDALTRKLSEQGVVVAWGEDSNLLDTLLYVVLPVLLVIALVIFLLRRMQGGTMNALELRRSRARLISEKGGVRFDDVGGCEEPKEQLRDLVDFLRQAERWTGAGVRLPRGVLLDGPPGCGKTLLARAVAGETEARFYLVSASEFVEMFVGVGAARVRDMFEIAAKEAPAVIFIDELDAVGRRRGSGLGAGHDEREQTLNQILVSMDGFETHDRVVVIAATNRADILDPALLRPGRFDRRVHIPALDRDARLEVLRIHTRNKTLSPDLSLEALADRTGGLSGADLENLANEAGLRAVRRARSREASEVPAADAITRDDFEQVIDAGTRARRFDRVDALLIESTTQVAQPTGRAVVRLKLEDGEVVEGELVWADASFLKLRSETGAETIVPKLRVKTIEAAAGTEDAEPGDVVADAWAAHTPDLA